MGVLSCRLDTSVIAAHVCTGSKRSPCARTGKPHFKKAGQEGADRAGCRPVQFCDALARCFQNSLAEGMGNRFGKQLAAGPSSRMDFGWVGVLVAARVRLPCGLSALGRWCNRLCAQSLAD